MGARTLQDVRGAVYVEYLTLLATVTLASVAGLVALGLPLLRLFRHAQMLVALPIP